MLRRLVTFFATFALIFGLFAFASIAPSTAEDVPVVASFVAEDAGAHPLDNTGEWRYETRGPYSENYCKTNGEYWKRYATYQLWYRWNWSTQWWEYSHTHKYWGDFIYRFGWCA